MDPARDPGRIPEWVEGRAAENMRGAFAAGVPAYSEWYNGIVGRILFVDRGVRRRRQEHERSEHMIRVSVAAGIKN